MHSVSITHTFHSDWCTIMLMTLLTYSEEVQQMWKYLEWMLRASASSHPESPRWAPCQFNHTASWHPAGKPCHVLILTMVDQSKANRKSSTKVTREAKMLLLVQFWQTGETFYLPSKFLGRGKWCREYWEDSQKYIVFIFRLKAKIILRRFMLSHLGVLCWLLYFTGGDGIHELPIQMELFTDRERSLTLFSHLRIVAAVDLHMLSQKIAPC